MLPDKKQDAAARQPAATPAPALQQGREGSSTPGGQSHNNDSNASGDNGYMRSTAPSISLPKGGGALKGIDEKFSVNAVNGTASLSMPLPMSPARGDFMPSLSLSYNSGSGNSDFGLGWGLSLPAIQRKTDKKLPEYNDAAESDVFLLAGAEDLVPAMKWDEGAGVWLPDAPDGPTGDYIIRRYRPRTEGLFARIEWIARKETRESWWKVTGQDNTVVFYGANAGSRLADPDDPGRIFRWLPTIAYDHRGNCYEYAYRPEDLVNVPESPHERQRLSGAAPIANLYLDRVRYGNKTPQFLSTDNLYEPIPPGQEGAQYFFELVLDYGDYDALAPTPEPAPGGWPLRKDPFSDFHAGFEIRTYRLCRRALLFHHFKELNDGISMAPTLVRSMDFSYAGDGAGGYLEADYMTAAQQRAYRKNSAGGYDSKAWPAMEFAYNGLVWDKTVHTVAQEDRIHAPVGLTSGYQWADLYNEGVPGILTEQAAGWYYKSNLGNGHFTPAQKVAPKPSFLGLAAGVLQLQDIDGDGRKQVVSRQPGAQGFWEQDDDQRWQNFRPFRQMPNIDWADPNLRQIDLDGDGLPDLLITEERALAWYPSAGRDGYAPRKSAPHFWDEDRGPAIVFSDEQQRIFLADMSGDGLTDIVRIRNGEVCYWPNRGYGRFGAKVTMTNAPWLDTPDQYNPAYIHLADISGTGAADIIYLGGNQFRAWLNLAGNAWSGEEQIHPFPSAELPNQIDVIDFLGNGTACIVWSSPLPEYATAPMCYIDLMGGNKPYLMRGYTNNLGKEVSVQYKSSTQYYLADKAAGTPWISRLPFPVHCIARTELRDTVSGSLFVNAYTYHHGYYDHAEREFRGFGRVDQYDTEEYDWFVRNSAGNIVEQDLYQPPVLTRTWYHTGVWDRRTKVLGLYRNEYFASPLFTEHLLPGPVLEAAWTAGEIREALRACKGMPLRQEVYGKDGSALEAIPYTATEFTYHLRQLQPQGNRRHAVYLALEAQSLAYNYDRNPADARVAHQMAITLDDYGNVLEGATVAYPRQSPPPVLPVGLPPSQPALTDAQSAIAATQARLHVVYYTATFTTPVTDDATHLLPLPASAEAWELGMLPPTSGYLSPAGVQNAFENATTVGYEAEALLGDKRRIESSRSQYLSNDTLLPLPLGVAESLALPYQQYRLALTPGILANTLDSRAGSSLLAEGGYIDLDGDGHWWMPSGKAVYHNPDLSFYQPTGFTDPFGNTASVRYYTDYHLLIDQTTDPLGNITAITGFDWRILQPTKLKDPNENLSQMAYDILGLPAGMALLGKGSEGDSLAGFQADLTPAQVAAFLNNPEMHAPPLLGNATARFVYDWSSLPVCVATIAREQHVAQLPPGTGSPLQMAFEYSNGRGEIAMKKMQAEPGEALMIDPLGNLVTVDTTPALRWVGSGRTVENNKGQPVKQYEPYYSVTHRYEEDDQLVEIGVTPVMYYDAPGRLMRTELPDGSFSSVTFDNWTVTTYDGSDNVAGSLWAAARQPGGPLAGDVREADALAKALVHDDTPTVAYLDSLGRECCMLAHNRYLDPATGNPVNDFLPTTATLDIEGNRLKITDARNLACLRYGYDMLGHPVLQISADGGKNLMLADVYGQPLAAWDADDRRTHVLYDELRRPAQLNITEPGSATEQVAQKNTYGESEDPALAKINNWLTRLVSSCDSAGRQRVNAYDFKGQPLAAEQELLQDYSITDVDWANPPLLTGEVFLTSTSYDALGRPLIQTAPGGNATRHTYDRGGLLNGVFLTLAGSATEEVYVQDIQYDAKGQRAAIWYGNGTKTAYTYDPLTYRLRRLLTTAGSVIHQDLRYWYDPAANITQLTDRAQQTLYFSNTVVSPDQDFTYDALYRLIKAEGREKKGAATFGTKDKWDDAAWKGGAMPGDPAAVQRYTQRFRYDGVGNILELKHIATAGSYTRAYFYSTANSRLTKTMVGATNYPLIHDVRGNVTKLPHVTSMSYNAESVMSICTVGGGIIGYYQYDSHRQRVRKAVVKTGGIREERIYLGSYELYRKYTGTTLTLERTTVHVSDDTGRIAMVERRTIGTDPAPALLKRFIYSNHLQSASLELNDAAQIISYEEYHPYGTTAYQATNVTIYAVAKRYRFTGKERDEESGLYYHGARYYVPWLGRWCAVDALEGKYAGLSPYGYIKDNPIYDTDSTGNGGDKDLKETPSYRKGVMFLDYAEWKGWTPPPNSGSTSERFQIGAYTLVPYYNQVDGKATGSPLYYTAGKTVDILEDFPNGSRTLYRNAYRSEFLIMPWGLQQFKSNIDNYSWQAALNYTRGIGNFEGFHLTLDRLQAIDGNNLGVLAEQWKGALADPTFYLGLALSVGKVSRGSIQANKPHLVSNKLSRALAGDASTAAELRVAERYRRGGNQVIINDADAGHASGRTYDMTINGVNIDVKRISGLGRIAAGDVAHGVRQVGEGGIVVVVRPMSSKFSVQQYQNFIRNFRPSLPNVRIILINENSLPKINKFRVK